MRTLIALLLVSISPPIARAADADPVAAWARERLAPRIEAAMRDARVPGFAIGIVADDRLAWTAGFGVMRLGGKKSVTPRTLFHMASVTKTFVATAIMQLAEQGRLDPDDPVVKHLPYFRLADARYRAITIRQLLTHTAGLSDVEDYAWDKPEYDARALERYVRSLAPLELISAPGEKFAYSNIGFEILGDVVAKVSGESFEAYVSRHILEPLRMTSSTLLVRKANRDLLASPHVIEDGRVVVSPVFPYNRAHAPSSTLYANVEDLSRWARAYLRGGELDGKRILLPATRDLLLTPQAPAMGESRVALSWFVTERHGRCVVTHSGADTGFQSYLALVPDSGIAIVAMANLDLDEQHPFAREIALKALDELVATSPTPERGCAH